jgi:RNA polymerase sigma-70 factor (ECF subfamily)
LKSEQLERFDQADFRHAALKNCLGKLKPKDRELLDARYCRNTPLGDLAAKLARPVGTIKKSLQRIRRALQGCIERTLASEERGV